MDHDDAMHIADAVERGCCEIRNTVRDELAEIRAEIHDTPSHVQVWAGQLLAAMIVAGGVTTVRNIMADHTLSGTIVAAAWQLAEQLHEQELQVLKRALDPDQTPL